MKTLNSKELASAVGGKRLLPFSKNPPLSSCSSATQSPLTVKYVTADGKDICVIWR